MKHFIVTAALAGLCVLPMTADAMQQADCKPADHSILTLNYISEPVVSVIGSETGDDNWERQRAIFERTLELSKLARHYVGKYKAVGYDLEARLIDAKYSIALAEVDQVADRNVKQADHEIKEAKQDVQSALAEAVASEKAPLKSLEGGLHRVKLSATECHGQSLGEDRYQYERLMSTFSQTIRAL